MVVRVSNCACVIHQTQERTYNSLPLPECIGPNSVRSKVNVTLNSIFSHPWHLPQTFWNLQEELEVDAPPYSARGAYSASCALLLEESIATHLCNRKREQSISLIPYFQVRRSTLFWPISHDPIWSVNWISSVLAS